jgi:N-methylhydantoinase A
MTNRIAIDVGGTFTDVVRLEPDGVLRFEKVPTTPAEPTRGVLAAFERAEAPIDDTAMFTHGTTLALNALLTRTGAKTAVVATRGFRDVYLLGRTARTGNYDIFYRKPPGLVERFDTYEVDERMLFDGSVHRPFDEESARLVAGLIRDRGYRSVAVAFLHSYANPDHEQAMLAVLRDVAPDVEVSLSSDLSREYREYERTSTAVLDAYTKPIIRTYLRVLQDRLDEGGFDGQFLMMRSGGGAMTAALAQDQPVNLILSGPAGGVVGAAGFAAITGEPNLVTVDMGGTSLDASLVVEGQPVLHQGAEFEGLPINTSSLYIHTIGAGGGSIAWLDEAGGLQVGPQSAGAVPGPASYGAGGEQPTFTDAALVMGYLGEETPLGETLTLRRDLATTALEPIAGELGMTVPELARGIVRISTTKITGAVRSITVELGRDPKDFALLAFGGAGGIVAVDVARELGMSKVIIPPGQGAFSAVGMLMADVQHDTSRTALSSLAELEAATVAKFWSEMADEASAVLAGQGFEPGRQVFTYAVDARYSGQEHTVTVPVPAGVEDPAVHVGEQFEQLHRRHYGHTLEDPIEVTTFRLSAVGVVDKPQLPLAERRTSGEPEPMGSRSMVTDEGAVSAGVYVRERLLAGDALDGPAVIVEHTATTVIHRGDRLRVGDHGELTITLGGVS